jgi:hypothetical protein
VPCRIRGAIAHQISRFPAVLPGSDDFSIHKYLVARARLVAIENIGKKCVEPQEISDLFIIRFYRCYPFSGVLCCRLYLPKDLPSKTR